MRVLKSSTVFVFFLSMSAWLGVCGLPNLQAREELDAAVRELLVASASGMQNVSIEYELRRRSDLPADELARRLPFAKTPEFLKPNTYRFVSAGTKWLTTFEIWMSPNQQLETSKGKNCFDGQLLFSTNLKTPAVVEIMDRKAREQSPLKDHFSYEYFLHNTGFAVSQKSLVDWAPLESAILSQLDLGAKLLRQSRLEAGLFEVELSFQSENLLYRLDLTRGAAIVQLEERTESRQIKYAIQNSEFLRLPNTNLWLPKKSTMACYTWPTISEISKDVLAYEELVVSVCHNNPVPESEFVVDWEKPGNLVGDSRHSDGTTEKVSFRVPANLSDMDEAIQAAKSGIEYVPRRSIVFRILAYVVLAIVVTMTLSRWLWNRFKKDS